jgi:hypothetical protein
VSFLHHTVAFAFQCRLVVLWPGKPVERSGDGGLFRGNRIEIARGPNLWAACPFGPQRLVALHAAARPAVFAGMSTKSRQTIYGGRIMGAKIRAESARKRAAEAARETTAPKRKHGRSRWKATVGQRNHRRPSGNVLNGGYGWLEVECHRCKTRASIPLDAIRRPRNTPIWKLEAALKCRSCKKGRYAPPLHMIKLTQEREITPYVWVHLDEERVVAGLRRRTFR